MFLYIAGSPLFMARAFNSTVGVTQVLSPVAEKVGSPSL